MISIFRMGSAASERGPGDTDRVLVRVAKSGVKNWEVLVWQKYTDNLCFQFDLWIIRYDRYIFFVQELPNFGHAI